MIISVAIFTESQSRLLSRLFGRPDRAFHLNKLRRLIGLNSASLHRELNRLASAGWVHKQAVGNMRRFQANPNSTIFSELVGLTRKSFGLVPILIEALMPLQLDLQPTWVYGSAAKQYDTASSDIDIMLVGNNSLLSRVFSYLEPAEAQLGRKTNPTCYSEQEFERRKAESGSFVNSVLSQSILSLLRNTNELG